MRGAPQQMLGCQHKKSDPIKPNAFIIVVKLAATATIMGLLFGNTPGHYEMLHLLTVCLTG
jgi:hypothetical protein